MQIESLTLSQSSDFHTICLEQTIESQKNEFARLNQLINSKSQQLLDAHRINHQFQKADKLHLKEIDNLNQRWQQKIDKLQTRFDEAEQINRQLHARIRLLETCLESDSTSSKLDSHNSSLPPSLDPP